MRSPTEKLVRRICLFISFQKWLNQFASKKISNFYLNLNENTLFSTTYKFKRADAFIIWKEKAHFICQHLKLDPRHAQFRIIHIICITYSTSVDNMVANHCSRNAIWSQVPIRLMSRLYVVFSLSYPTRCTDTYAYFIGYFSSMNHEC